MSRHGNDHGVEPRDFLIAACFFGLCLVGEIQLSVRTGAQDPGTPPDRIRRAGPPGRAAQPASARRHARSANGAPGPELRPGVSAVGPIITPEGHGPEGPPLSTPSVQVVRFQGPPGLSVEVLAPEPSPVPIGDGERHRHGRPAARSRLPLAADQYHRASRRRALSRDRSRGTPAPAPGDRARPSTRSA